MRSGKTGGSLIIVDCGFYYYFFLMHIKVHYKMHLYFLKVKDNNVFKLKFFYTCNFIIFYCEEFSQVYYIIMSDILS